MAARSPHNTTNIKRVHQSTDEFLEAANIATQGSIRKMLIVELATAAAQMASAARQCIANAQVVTPENTNKHSQQTLLDTCKDIASRMGKLVQVSHT